MFLHTTAKTTGVFIVYSSYGLQSHAIVNNYGVPFTCNTKGDTMDEESAKLIASQDPFYTQYTEIQWIAKLETNKSFEERK